MAGKKPRQRLQSRRHISQIEWGTFIGRSDQTIRKLIALYEKAGHAYNDKDIYSVLNFHSWLRDSGLIRRGEGEQLC